MDVILILVAFVMGTATGVAALMLSKPSRSDRETAYQRGYRQGQRDYANREQAARKDAKAAGRRLRVTTSSAVEDPAAPGRTSKARIVQPRHNKKLDS